MEAVWINKTPALAPTAAPLTPGFLAGLLASELVGRSEPHDLQLLAAIDRWRAGDLA